MEVRARGSAGEGPRWDAVRTNHRRPRARFMLAVLWLLALVLVTPTSATSTRYVYDVAGRLIAVTNDAGESARYVYDVMGNLLQVERLAAGELALFTFTPDRGVAGTQVRLQGNGFSTEPSANSVNFAGVPASVLSATGTELVTLVPAGATTGPISITVGTQTVASSSDFTVDQHARIPRIDDVSPLIAAAGSSLTVTGDGLYPLPHQTTARIGTRAGLIGTIQNEQLDFTVPTIAASGKVSVSTPYGLATSTQDVLVLPTGVNIADIAAFRRITPDAPATPLSIQTPGQQVALLFDATAGEYLDVQFSSISAGHITYALYDPSNRNVANGVADASLPTALLPPAAGAGTYLLLLRPAQGPASWNLGIERSRKLLPGAEPLALATTVPAQKKRVIFAADTDKPLGLGVSDLNVTPDSALYVYVYNRDVNLTGTTCYTYYNGCQLNLRATQSGVHAVVFGPSGNNETFQGKVTLSDDLQLPLQREVPLDLTLQRRGQNARLTFNAQAGESLALQVVNQSTQPAERYVNYALYRPDGTLQTSVSVLRNELLNLPTLSQSGQYTVFVDSDYGALASSRIILREGTAGLVDSDARAFSTENGGQSIYFSFDVSEVDQRLGVGISDLVLSTSYYVSMSVYRPDGSYLTGATCYDYRGGCEANIRAPMVGRYTVVVQPFDANQTMQLKAWVSNDLQADISRETPLQLDIARRGQNARLYFDAQLGDSLAVLVAGQTTMPAAEAVYYQIYRPDGTLLSSSYVTTHEVVRLSNVGEAGRYMLFVDPANGATVQARITLTDGRQTPLAIDGADGSFVAPIDGHPAYMNFSTTVPDQRLGLAVRDLELSTGWYVSASLYGPNGDYVNGTTCYTSQNGCDLNIRATVVGTYSLVLTPMDATQRMRFTATVSNDKVLALVREQALDLALDRFGQNGRLKFTAEAGENLALQITGQSVTANAGAHYTVYKPDGSALASVTPGTHGDLTLMSLPLSGEYFVFVDPYYGSQLQARVLLTAGNGGAAEIDGDPDSVSTAYAGQSTFATFDVEEADQRLGLGISDLVLSSGYYLAVAVYTPTGTYLTGATCYVSSQGCDLNLRAPVVGTYGIVVTPQEAAQTMSYTLTLSNDLRRLLPRETTLLLDIPRRGQNARLSFNAQVGETLGLKFAGQVTVPVGQSVSYQVYTPDGSMFASRTITQFETLNLPALPATGQYMVFVDPAYGATVGAQLTLTSGADSGTVIDGTPGEFSTTVPGQPTFMTFQATAGEKLGLGISDLVLSDGYYFSVSVYRPGGAYAGGTICYSSAQGCALGIDALDSGTYSVVTTPQSANQTVQFKATLSRDLRLNLVRNEPLDLDIARRGQNARLSFNGQAGESLALQVAGQTTMPGGSTVTYRVYRPDGSTLGLINTSAFDSLELRLPDTGTYLVLVGSSYGETIKSRVTLTAGTALPVDGNPVQLQSTLGGQPLRATFQATQGQSLGVGLHDLTLSSGSYGSMYVYRPDGTYVTATTCYASNTGCKVSLTAAQAGTYSVVFTPQQADQVASYRLTVSQDVEATLQADVPMQLVLTRRGQNARIRFNGEAGQWLNLQIAGQATVPTQGYVYYRIYRPDGSHLASSGMYTHGGIELPVLPESGQYLLLVDSELGQTLQTRLTLATGTSTLALDGGSAMVDTDVGGQYAYLTFQATQGQHLGVGMSDIQLTDGSYFNVWLYGPDGSSTSNTCYPSYGGCDLRMAANASGRYRLYMQPQSAQQTMRFTVTASTDLRDVLERNTALPLSLARHGQSAALAFEGSSGDALSLRIASQTTHPIGAYVYYTVYRPDGSMLSSNIASTDGVQTLPVLPVGGTYTMMVDPSYGATVDVELTLQ